MHTSTVSACHSNSLNLVRPGLIELQSHFSIGLDNFGTSLDKTTFSTILNQGDRRGLWGLGMHILTGKFKNQ